MVGTPLELLRDLSRLEVCGEWDACKAFLLPVVYLGAHMGSEVGLGSDGQGFPWNGFSGGGA